MPNHYHLVLETPELNLVAGMAWLQSTYTIRLNPRHELIGHVLSGRYKSQLVEGSGNGYLKTACDYVHLNPVRARLLKRGDLKNCSAAAGRNNIWSRAGKMIPPSWRLRLGCAGRRLSPSKR